MKPLRSKVKVKSLKMNKNVSNRKDKVVSDLISEISKNKKGCQINVFNKCIIFGYNSLGFSTVILTDFTTIVPYGIVPRMT